MLRLFLLFLLAVFLSLAVAVLGAALSSGKAGLAGCGDWLRLIEQLQDERRTQEALARRHEQIGSNLVLRRRVVADLLAGRITLAHAAARFRELDAIYPAVEYAAFPGRSEEERLQRAVIEWACNDLLTHSPEEVARVRTRLEAALDASTAHLATLHQSEECRSEQSHCPMRHQSCRPKTGSAACPVSQATRP
jgi:hypothetical protein